MKNEIKKARDEYFNVMNALADSVAQMSDDEVEEEILEDGDNTEEARLVLSMVVNFGKKQALFEAKEQYKKSLRSYQERAFELPRAPEDKRRLILSMLGSTAQGKQQLTAQFRNFEDLPDEDLDGILQQLLALQSGMKSEE